MKYILQFFVTWILFGLVLYALVSLAQGTFDPSVWAEGTREGTSVGAGMGGFIFSLFSTLITTTK